MENPAESKPSLLQKAAETAATHLKYGPVLGPAATILDQYREVEGRAQADLQALKQEVEQKISTLEGDNEERRLDREYLEMLDRTAEEISSKIDLANAEVKDILYFLARHHSEDSGEAPLSNDSRPLILHECRTVSGAVRVKDLLTAHAVRLSALLTSKTDDAPRSAAIKKW